MEHLRCPKCGIRTRDYMRTTVHMYALLCTFWHVLIGLPYFFAI